MPRSILFDSQGRGFKPRIVQLSEAQITNLSVYFQSGELPADTEMTSQLKAIVEGEKMITITRGARQNVINFWVRKYAPRIEDAELKFWDVTVT